MASSGLLRDLWLNPLLFLVTRSILELRLVVLLIRIECVARIRFWFFVMHYLRGIVPQAYRSKGHHIPTQVIC